MNHIYKVVWSKSKNCYVVASEFAKSATKSKLGSFVLKKGNLLASIICLALSLGIGSASAATITTLPTDTREQVHYATGVNGVYGANSQSLFTSSVRGDNSTILTVKGANGVSVKMTADPFDERLDKTQTSRTLTIGLDDATRQLINNAKDTDTHIGIGSYS